MTLRSTRRCLLVAIVLLVTGCGRDDGDVTAEGVARPPVPTTSAQSNPVVRPATAPASTSSTTVPVSTTKGTGAPAPSPSPSSTLPERREACDPRSAEERQRDDPLIWSVQPFGDFQVVIHWARPAQDGRPSEQVLDVLDCARGLARRLPPPPPGRPCSSHGGADLTLDGRSLLYTCHYQDQSGAENGYQVVVRDVASGAATRIPEPDGYPYRAGRLAAGGRLVVFEGGEVRWHEYRPWNVYVYDRSRGALSQLSRAFLGARDRDNSLPSLSEDGSRMLFVSVPRDLPPERQEVVLHDWPDGPFTLLEAPSRWIVDRPVLSGDGAHAVGTWSVEDGDTAVYVFDGAGPGTFVSLCTLAGAGVRDCYPAISADGRLVTFTAWPCVEVTGVDHRRGGTFRYDRVTGATEQLAPFDGDVPCV